MSEVEPLFKEDKNGFEEFYNIYLVSFHPSEQKQKKELLEMLNSPGYTIFTSKIGGKIVGFCAVFHSLQTSFFLLEYMAVASAYRGLKIGTELFLHVRERLVKMHGPKPFLVEIDSPWQKSGERDIREKRERFYRNMGCRIIDPLDYILPIKSENSPPNMKLMIHCESTLDVSGILLRKWLEDIYMLVYGCQKDDERIDKMLLDAPQILKLI